MTPLSEKTLKNFADKYGTPLFVYQAESIIQKYQALQNNLMNNCSIFYSMKANPTVAICQLLNALGASCEVSSQYELLIALKAGYHPNKIIFVGPGKTVDDLSVAIDLKIKSIVCESINEIAQVNYLSQQSQCITSVMIRVNPEFCVSKAPIKMSGVASQFGTSENDLCENWNSINQYKNISIDGLQIYNASRVLDEDALCENISHILALSDRLSRKLGKVWRYVDIGGGFGIPYFENETSINSEALTRKIDSLFNQYSLKYQETQFFIELGRYLVAESGYFVSKIHAVKQNHGKQFVITDGGLNCFMPASGLGSFVHRNFKFFFIRNENRSSDESYLTYQVVGPLCTPGDNLLKGVA